jgi:hypothetical protein
VQARTLQQPLAVLRSHLFSRSCHQPLILSLSSGTSAPGYCPHSHLYLASNTMISIAHWPSSALPPPTRKACGTKHLEQLYSTALAETIKQIKIAGEFQVTMDGWKKRAAEHGTPLVTVVVLLPDGGSLFWKVSSLQTSHAFLLLCNGHNCVLIAHSLFLA